MSVWIPTGQEQSRLPVESMSWLWLVSGYKAVRSREARRCIRGHSSHPDVPEVLLRTGHPAIPKPEQTTCSALGADFIVPFSALTSFQPNCTS